MQAVTTIGFDIAKSVFQVHGVDLQGNVIIRRQLKRRHVLGFFRKLPPCLVGMEACASSHHWLRELQQRGDFGVRGSEHYGYAAEADDLELKGLRMRSISAGKGGSTRQKAAYASRFAISEVVTTAAGVAPAVGDKIMV
jgi:transposase